MKTEDHDPRQQLDAAINSIRNQPEPEKLKNANRRVWARVASELRGSAKLEAGREEGSAAAGMSATGTVDRASLEKIRGCADFEALLPAYREASLPPARALLMQDHLRECIPCRRRYHNQAQIENLATAWMPAALAHKSVGWNFSRAAIAALLIATAGLGAFFTYGRLFALPAGPRATVQAVDGVVYRVAENGEQALRAGDQLAEGEHIRTAAGSHAFVRLYDGSNVEMNERAEFFVSAGRRSTLVELVSGNIIVQAAKRRTGHLYVDSKDCRVAVTGTMFSVNSATKGSRVAVIEGEVRVAQNGNEAVLRPGDEYESSPNLGSVPIAEEIAWSRNLQQNLALLAEFSKFQKKLEAIPSPRLHYSSDILALLPASTAMYASVPNYGEALGQAYRIFQEQLSNSAVLRNWWEKNRMGSGPQPEEIIQTLRGLSQYVGDEVVAVAFRGRSGRYHQAVIARAERSGISDYLQSVRFANGQPLHLRIFDAASLMSAAATPRAAGEHDEIMVLVRPDFVLFAPDVEALQILQAQLNAGSSGFTETAFGQRILASYRHGVSLLWAGNLEAMTEAPSGRMQVSREPREPLRYSGFEEVKYLVIERTETSGVSEQRAVVSFSGERRGIASWLAPPAPMNSLDFISDNASLAASLSVKSPALMLDDLLRFLSVSDPKAQSEITVEESKLNLRFRDDVAATLGGDVSFALDGPMLPTPSWKMVAEVYDPARLQSSLQRLVQGLNQENQLRHKAEAHLEQEQIDSQVYYVLRSVDRKGLPHEVHYTFFEGYLIVAPSRAILMNTLRSHAQGTTLARSPNFRSLLPSDEHANFSGILYQNLAPALGPLASVVNTEQLRALQSLAADSKPSVVCAYGEPDQIQVVSASNFFGIGLNTLALSELIGGELAVRRPADGVRR